jgi:ribosome-associated protein
MQAASADAQALLHIAVDALEELKAVEVKVLEVGHLTPLMDYMVVASGTSDRQIRAMAENVIKRSKASGHPPMGIEGDSAAEWVLVDLCDVVVHVMNQEARDTYQLEKLWAGPVAKRAAEETPSAS